MPLIFLVFNMQICFKNEMKLQTYAAAVALIVRAFAFHADSRAFKYWWQQTYVVKQIVTIPLPNTWKQVRMLITLGDNSKNGFHVF